jgi:DNA-binding SARP family transcriptional activator
MEFRVLGTFEVTRGGSVVTPSAPKLRRVLALLSVRANSLVHTRQLVDELWEDRPPASSSTTLQTYIYQLRKLLGLAEQGQAAALYTRPSGYLLGVPADALDRCRFDELAARGAEEMRRGYVEAAADTLRAALHLWRGPALSDVEQGLHLQADIVHLEECRNSVLEMRLDADLSLGRYQQLISELTAQTARNPTQEGMHGRLMLALYRAGRRSEALQVFQRIRAALAAELGLEPGPDLQHIHRAVLASDPVADGYGGAAVTAGGTLRVADPPAQLPPDVALIGRDAELAEVERMLVGRTGTAATAVSVVGAPGVGTTAFCVRAAHRVRAAFPDGQFFARLGDTATPAAILADFLQATGVPASGIPPNLEARSAMFRSWAADRRILVVVDNVTNAGQILPLLPSGPGCATLAASDRLLCDPTIYAVVELRPLSVEHATELLMAVAGRERVRRDAASARALVDSCGGLPLVLLAAATKLALRPHWRIDCLTDRLTDESDRLHELTTDKLDIRDSVLRRYRLLSREYREAFRTIALSGGQALTAREAGVLLRVDERAAEAILEQLVECQLAEVAPVDNGSTAFRYRLRPLVPLVARTLGDEPTRPRLSVAGSPAGARVAVIEGGAAGRPVPAPVALVASAPGQLRAAPR